jgi:mRNA interferase MazF
MSRTTYRGEIYYAELDPAIGSEQAGNRPVLVLQNNIGNFYSPTVIIAPITSKRKMWLPTHHLLVGAEGLESASIVLLEQIRTIDKQRLGRFVGALDRREMSGVDDALAVSVGLRQYEDGGRTEGDSLLLTLCPNCARQFYNSPEYKIRRANPAQDVKESCVYCSSGRGFDFIVTSVRAKGGGGK